MREMSGLSEMHMPFVKNTSFCVVPGSRRCHVVSGELIRPDESFPEFYDVMEDGVDEDDHENPDTCMPIRVSDWGRTCDMVAFYRLTGCERHNHAFSLSGLTYHRGYFTPPEAEFVGWRRLAGRRHLQG